MTPGKIQFNWMRILNVEGEGEGGGEEAVVVRLM